MKTETLHQEEICLTYNGKATIFEAMFTSNLEPTDLKIKIVYQLFYYFVQW